MSSTLNSGEILTIIAALGGLVTAIGAVITNIILTIRKQVAEVSAKADVIAGHVNSAATEAKTKVEALQRELQQVREFMAEKNQVAALLAQAAVATQSLPQESTVMNKPADPVNTKPIK